jgi:nucleoside 2-deoxyribosyltransferase
MIITICGSIKFMDEMKKAEAKLKKLGHKVLMPVKAEGVDYWAEDNKDRVEAKKKFGFIGKHMSKIEKSDAILVVNVTKKGIKNYIGANTFLEMGFAYYRKKKIFTLNALPNQPYIIDELLTFNPIILNGDLSKIK